MGARGAAAVGATGGMGTLLALCRENVLTDARLYNIKEDK